MYYLISNHFIPTVLILWISLCFSMAYISGWMTLRKHYKHNKLIDGTSFNFQSFRTRNGPSYSKIVNFKVGSKGIKFSVFPIIPCHFSFVIPWEQISDYEYKKSDRSEYIVITCSALPNKQILLFRNVAKTCNQYLKKLKD